MPVKCPPCPSSPTPLPSPEDLIALLRGVVDPELGSDIVDLGMVRSATADESGDVVVTIALTTSGCPLRAQIQRDIRARIGSGPGCHRCPHRVDRDDPGAEVVGHGQGALQRQPARAADVARTDHPGRDGGLRQGRRRQVLRHRQPGRRDGRPRSDGRRARRRRVGLLGSSHARARRPARRAATATVTR